MPARRTSCLAEVPVKAQVRPEIAYRIGRNFGLKPALQHLPEIWVSMEACSKRLPTKLTSRVFAGQTIKQDHVRVLE
jgi:hypothetical protein